MILVQAEELIVAITSEGISETRDDLEGVERSMEDTADSAGNSAEELEGFSQRFSGAVSAAVAALAVGAAGLLSQVPAIGEAMSGLFSIVEALAFQMDSVLRPALSPITDFFFDVANAIFEADGAIGTIIGVIASFVSIGAVVITTVAAIGSMFGVWASATGGVMAILTALGSVVAGLLSTLAGLVSLPAVIIGAIVAFAAAYALNLGGVRDTTNDILGSVWDFFVGLASDLSSWAGDLASDAWDWGSDAIGGMLDGIRDVGSGVFDWFSGLASDLTAWADDLASDAFGWGRSIITQFIDGIESMLGVLRDVLEDMPFIGQILSLFDRLTDALSDIELSGSAQANISRSLSGAFGDGGSGGNDNDTSTGASSRPRFGAGRATSTRGQQIDGRQISESTGRYRADPSNRRGL